MLRAVASTFFSSTRAYSVQGCYSSVYSKVQDSRDIGQEGERREIRSIVFEIKITVFNKIIHRK